jgi:hypothetical protein
VLACGGLLEFWGTGGGWEGLCGVRLRCGVGGGLAELGDAAGCACAGELACELGVSAVELDEGGLCVL